MYDPVDGSVGGYWAASCKEEVKVIFDQPKKVIAGAGFTYEAKLTVSRTCTPKLLKNIVKKPKCKSNVGVDQVITMVKVVQDQTKILMIV